MIIVSNELSFRVRYEFNRPFLEAKDLQVFYDNTSISCHSTKFINLVHLNNFCHWLHHILQENDAHAVEATSYALITMFLVEGGGVTPIQGQIVRWLNTMRLGTGGFISAVDTIAALQALVYYSYHSRIKVYKTIVPVGFNWYIYFELWICLIFNNLHSFFYLRTSPIYTFKLIYLIAI